MGTAFLSGWFILTFIFALFVSFLGYWMMASIYYWYSGSIIPFIFIASIYGLGKFKPFSRNFLNFALGYILANILITNFFLGNHFFRINFPYKEYWPKKERAVVFEAGRLIPQDAPLIVDSSAGPWFAFRKEYHVISSNNLNSLEKINRAKSKVDFILIYTNSQNPFKLTILETLASERAWSVLFDKDGWLLVKKGASGKIFDKKFIKRNIKYEE